MPVKRTLEPLGRPTASRLLGLSLPILYTSILQSAGVSVNLVWIAHYLGASAVAAIANANVLLMVLYGITFGIATASAILIGIYVGGNSFAEARHVVGASVICFVLGSLVVGVVAAGAAGGLLTLIHAPTAARALASNYLKVMLLGMPIFYLYAFVIFVLRATGDSKTPLLYMGASVVLDLLLTPMLIRGIGRAVPALGITGSALATLVAQSAGLIGLVLRLRAGEHLLFPRRKDLRLVKEDWLLAGELLRQGIPITAQYSGTSVQELLLMYLVNRYGVTVAAAYGASMQLWSYLQMPASAIAVGVTAMSAQYIGAGRGDRYQTLLPIGIAAGVLLTGITVTAVYLMGADAFRPFLRADSVEIQVAMHINGVVGWSFVLLSIATIALAAENARGSVWAPVCILFGVALTRFLATDVAVAKWHAEAIWWSFPIFAAITSILSVVYHRYGASSTLRSGAFGRLRRSGGS